MFVGWLFGPLVGCLVCWSAGWLLNCLVGQLVACSIGWLADWLIDWLLRVHVSIVLFNGGGFI